MKTQDDEPITKRSGMNIYQTQQEAPNTNHVRINLTLITAGSSQYQARQDEPKASSQLSNQQQIRHNHPKPKHARMSPLPNTVGSLQWQTLKANYQPNTKNVGNNPTPHIAGSTHVTSYYQYNLANHSRAGLTPNTIHRLTQHQRQNYEHNIKHSRINPTHSITVMKHV